MAWVRIDDHFDEHPKLAKVGPICWGVWLAGIAYCNRNLTDGFIPFSIAESISAKWKILEQTEKGELVWIIGRTSGHEGHDVESEWIISLLVEAELWERAVGGFLIHDYEDFQPTKAEVEEMRRKKIEAGRFGGQASAQARAQAPAQARAQAHAQARAQAKHKQVLKQNPTPNPKPKPKGRGRG